MFKRSFAGYLAVFLALSSGTAYAALNGSEPVARTSAAPCSPGYVHGFARIKGSSRIGSVGYTTDANAIDKGYICTGSFPEVRREATGRYFVRFPGNSATLAVAIANSDGLGPESINNDNVLSVAKITSGQDAGSFRVEVQDVGGSDGTDPQDGQFTLMLM